MTIYTELNVLGVIITAMGGSLLGICVLYVVGNILSAERLCRRLEGKIGQIFRREDVFKACDCFTARGKVRFLTYSGLNS